MQPLVELYTGTLSLADQRILAIFRLFEAQRKVSAASLFTGWPARNGVETRSVLDAFTELDSTRVFRTALSFPVHVALNPADKIDSDEAITDSSVYDPVFVMLLCAQTLQTSPPTSALSWVSFFRTNAISLTFRCLSCRDAEMRELALKISGCLYELMQVRFSFPSRIGTIH